MAAAADEEAERKKRIRDSFSRLRDISKNQKRSSSIRMNKLMGRRSSSYESSDSSDRKSVVSSIVMMQEETKDAITQVKQEVIELKNMFNKIMLT